MIDIHIDDKNGTFKFRTCIILKYKDKYLLTKMHDNKFYCFPGGHIELGETTQQGVIREAKEELNIDIKIDGLFAIHENLSKNGDKVYHELGYYYICHADDESKLNTQNYIYYENDKGLIIKHEFIWVTLEELKNVVFLPVPIKELLLSKSNSINNIISTKN